MTAASKPNERYEAEETEAHARVVGSEEFALRNIMHVAAAGRHGRRIAQAASVETAQARNQIQITTFDAAEPPPAVHSGACRG